jgi:hypothetical protein
MALPRHPQVATWLANLEDEARAEVDQALAYLEQHGRAAALPDVRHRVQTAKHFPNMSEVRVDIGQDQAYRVLVGFGPDDVPALLLAGNKAGIGNAWYVSNVPVADERFDAYLRALAKSKEKPK